MHSESYRPATNVSRPTTLEGNPTEMGGRIRVCTHLRATREQCADISTHADGLHAGGRLLMKKPFVAQVRRMNPNAVGGSLCAWHGRAATYAGLEQPPGWSFLLA